MRHSCRCVQLAATARDDAAASRRNADGSSTAHRKFQSDRSVMNELDFSARQVLVIGGSSGIGNGIAQAFRAKGARVAVCGTRERAADYAADEGSHLEGLDYHRLDV